MDHLYKTWAFCLLCGTRSVSAFSSWNSCLMETLSKSLRAPPRSSPKCQGAVARWRFMFYSSLLLASSLSIPASGCLPTAYWSLPHQRETSSPSALSAAKCMCCGGCRRCSFDFCPATSICAALCGSTMIPTRTFWITSTAPSSCQLYFGRCDLTYGFLRNCCWMKLRMLLLLQSAMYNCVQILTTCVPAQSFWAWGANPVRRAKGRSRCRPTWGRWSRLVRPKGAIATSCILDSYSWFGVGFDFQGLTNYFCWEREEAALPGMIRQRWGSKWWSFCSWRTMC